MMLEHMQPPLNFKIDIPEVAMIERDTYVIWLISNICVSNKLESLDLEPHN